DQIMKEINSEYETLFDYITAHMNNEQRFNTKKAGHSVNDGYREAINAIIHLPGIEIEICGSWVWVSGNTKQYKDIFKANNYHWASKKIMWYFRPEEYKQTFNKKSQSMDYIRNKYGSERIQTEEFKKVT
ncbi:MAG TPA: molecular chaperone DnaJ, partial [Actinobacteria bacterium]|nr:molecular chaperone DnaJ [Actinomycetota bacterium]